MKLKCRKDICKLIFFEKTINVPYLDHKNIVYYVNPITKQMVVLKYIGLEENICVYTQIYLSN